MANTYLALGETARASAELAAVSHVDDSESDYQYLLAQANVYQQQHHSTQALSAFAAAAGAAGEDQTAEQNLLQAGANEGYRINPEVSALSDLTIQPIFEDSTVYVLDAKTFGQFPAISSTGVVNVAELPPPRSSLETDWTTAYHLHLGGATPTAGGFFQIRNARGLVSVPATAVTGPGGVVTGGIVNRDTTDYTINFGVDPTLRLGTNVLTFNSGIQGTIRRDSLSPAANGSEPLSSFHLSDDEFFLQRDLRGWLCHPRNRSLHRTIPSPSAPSPGPSISASARPGGKRLW